MPGAPPRFGAACLQILFRLRAPLSQSSYRHSVVKIYALALNNSHMFVCSVVALWPRKGHIRETQHSHGQRTDLLYVVRNENADLLFTTMSTSLAGNIGSNVRLWLLSNSDDLDFQSAEPRLIRRLQEKFGMERVSLFGTRENPLRRKHICIHEWLEAHPESCHILICDADTVLPGGFS